jgi:membrane fusion protein (multidrug efflux system)
VFRAELDRAEAGRALSEENYQRAEALLKEHSISELERDEAYAQWQLDEATTRLARAQLDKATIKAPFAGALGLRQISIGDYIQPGQPLVNLEDTRKLKIDFQVPEKYSAQVRIGQKVYLQTDAYPEQQFVGEVYAINPLIDEASRSLAVRGLLDNSDNKLRPGLFAKVSLVLASKADAIFIPEQALIPQPAKQLVFKVVDGTAQMVQVQTGQRVKGWVEIASGLSAGDVVITGGHQKIGPGSPIHALPADPALFSQLVNRIDSTEDNS